MIIFWGYEDFVEIFGGSSQNWTGILGVISLQFTVFSEGKLLNWNDILVDQYSKISLGYGYYS